MTDVPGYVLDRLIGRGASGEVWLARQRSAGGRVVAVKCLVSPDESAARDRLRVEGRLLAALDHPHIVTLFDVVERPGGVALIMQYAAGGSLAALLGQRRLTAGQLVTLCAPLADALGYAHAHGTVHGDVTPANVLFTDDGRPLLADFGIARVAARLSARSGLVGTPHYLDPQVALGAAPDAASDLYALAAICYEALTGRPPHIGATPFELLQRARDGERPAIAELAPDTPAALIAAIDQALSPDPGSRSANAAEFAAQLRAAAEPEAVRMLPRDVPVPVSAPALPTTEFGPRPPRAASIDRPAPGAWDRLSRLGADRRVRFGALASLVAAALASVGLLVLGRGDSGAAVSGPPPVARVSMPSNGAAAQVAATSATQAAAAQAAAPPAGAPPVGATPQAQVNAASEPVRSREPEVSPVTAQEWRSVLAGLDARRSRAYETADVALIDSVYSPGPDQAKDHERVAALAADKQRVIGLRLDYRDIRVLTSNSSEATLDVVDELPAYRQVDAQGKLVKAYAARSAKRWLISFKRTSEGWRIAAIATAS